MSKEFTAIIERNTEWSNGSASEPYEVGWAKEAIVFARTLIDCDDHPLEARIQFSPDGMRWIDSGDTINIPHSSNEIEMARFSHFGNWIRLRVVAHEKATRRVLVTLHLKE